MSLGQVQIEEGYSSDAVETYLRVLALQEGEDPDEVADAHVQASLVVYCYATALDMCAELVVGLL